MSDDGPTADAGAGADAVDSDAAAANGHDGAGDGHDDHHGPTGWRYWLYTTDHRVIGIIYLWHALFFFALGGVLALVFRTELALSPDSALLSAAGYNSLISVHALTMIFLVILPLSGAFANYFIPLMVGADEMAFPRMNALGAWDISAGGLLVYLPFLTNALGLTGLATNAGWFQYPPLNVMLNTAGTDLGILGIAVFGVTSTGSAINFLVTVLNERRPDMGWFDVPIFIWALGVFTSILALYSIPWLLSAWGMTWLERNLGMTFFAAKAGGDPLLYQWLFWTFGHPEVYVLVLPGMGIAVEVVSRFSERPIYGYRALLGSLVALSVLSLGVWAHHMFATGLEASRYAFMVFSMGIVVAFGVYLYCCIATMWKGRVHLTTPMLFSVALLVGLVYSGMEGIMLGQPASDLELHSTYFVVGHFHFTLFMVGVFGLLAGVYYWYPRMTGRMYDARLAKFHAATTIAGVPLLFFTIGRLGELGMMRRYATYTYAPELQGLHVVATVLAFVVATGQLAFFANVLWSLRNGRRVDNPWADLVSGDMGSPEWTGFPYRPPTPAAVRGGTAADGGEEVATDGGDDVVADEDEEVATDGGEVVGADGAVASGADGTPTGADATAGDVDRDATAGDPADRDATAGDPADRGGATDDAVDVAGADEGGGSR